jgi:SAM-dependent methyltransferase
MLDRSEISRKAQAAFDEIWRGGDPWDLDTATAVRTSHEHQLELLSGRRYARALEIGCGAGAFTRRLAEIADSILAIDVAASAIEHARTLGLDPGRVDFRVLNAMDLQPQAEGPFDLVVFSEAVYCIGWLYPLFDLGWLVSELHEATTPGGRLLLANTYGSAHDYLLSPWLIDTYRDLVRNVGWSLEHEDVLAVEKDGVDFEIVVGLYERVDR